MISSKSKTSNVLLTLGILFTLGGAARFLPAAIATAEDGPETEIAASAAAAQTASMLVTDAKDVPSASTGAPDEVCLTGKAAEALTADKKRIEEELAALTQSQLELTLWEAELEAQAKDLTALRDALDQRWADMQRVSDEDLQHLAKMYGSMKPNQAAQIFNQMDPAFAAGFLRMINSDQAGLVLAQMDTSKAYIVSVELANTNADIRNAKD